MGRVEIVTLTVPLRSPLFGKFQHGARFREQTARSKKTPALQANGAEEGKEEKNDCNINVANFNPFP